MEGLDSLIIQQVTPALSLSGLIVYAIINTYCTSNIAKSLYILCSFKNYYLICNKVLLLFLKKKHVIGKFFCTFSIHLFLKFTIKSVRSTDIQKKKKKL